MASVTDFGIAHAVNHKLVQCKTEVACSDIVVDKIEVTSVCK